MAIHGVGIDLIRIDRLHRLLARWGERFEKRIFTEAEREACSRRSNYAACLAMRFSAKEAFVKALGTGIRGPVVWLDMEVLNNPLGRPQISLSHRAERFCRERGVTSWHLSLTDDGEYGAAVVVIESSPHSAGFQE